MAAINAAHQISKGQSLEEVKARLVVELRNRDVFLSPNMVELYARDMVRRTWSLRHPLKVRRLLRQGQDEAQAAELAADSAQARLERVCDEYVDVTVRLRASRTMDGMRHEALIDPWSDDLAQRLRACVAPIPLDVRPLSTDKP